MLPGKKRALTARSGVVCGFVLMGFAAVTGASLQNLTSPSMSGVPRAKTKLLKLIRHPQILKKIDNVRERGSKRETVNRKK